MEIKENKYKVPSPSPSPMPSISLEEYWLWKRSMSRIKKIIRILKRI
jgi:hypothetical protein